MKIHVYRTLLVCLLIAGASSEWIRVTYLSTDQQEDEDNEDQPIPDQYTTVAQGWLCEDDVENYDAILAKYNELEAKIKGEEQGIAGSFANFLVLYQDNWRPMQLFIKCGELTDEETNVINEDTANDMSTTKFNFQFKNYDVFGSIEIDLSPEKEIYLFEKIEDSNENPVAFNEYNIKPELTYRLGYNKEEIKAMHESIKATNEEPVQVQEMLVV